VDEIAAMARVSPATVYAVAGGKQGLLRTLMDISTTAPMVAETIDRITIMDDAKAVMALLARRTRLMREEFGEIMRPDPEDRSARRVRVDALGAVIIIRADDEGSANISASSAAVRPKLETASHIRRDPSSVEAALDILGKIGWSPGRQQRITPQIPVWERYKQPDAMFPYARTADDVARQLADPDQANTTVTDMPVSGRLAAPLEPGHRVDQVCRLRPLIFLPASYPERSSFLGTLCVLG
jgi:AcrR family transcriptional regulator